MSSDFLQLDTVSIVAAIVGGFILLYGLCSLFIKERLYLSEVSVAFICGIVFGPLCAKFVDVQSWGNEEIITHEFTRIVIGIQVMACGVTLPKAYLRKELKSLLMLLGPTMIYMWLISGLLVWALIPGLNYLEALMIAACFTPTDPVLCNSIVQGKFAEKHVPVHLRHLILCESGANDGLGYPFLFLAIYLMQMDVGPAIGKWAYFVMAYNILLSIVIGFLAGYIARKLLKYCEKNNLIDKESFLVFSIALALLLMGLVGIIGSDDLLACFIAGNSLTWNDWYRVESERAHLMEVVDNLLNISIFIYIGVTMPWSAFYNADTQVTVWRLVVLGILVLLLRRLPIIMSLYKFIPSIRNWREALFTGWFGPIGVGALFYYTVARESIPAGGPNAHAREVLEPVVYFMVLASIVAHGITIPLFYTSKFATRTLTRTSDAGHSSVILRIPKKMDLVFQRKNNNNYSTPPLPMDESDLADFQKTPEQPAKKFTAITILTPDEMPKHVYNNNARTYSAESTVTSATTKDMSAVSSRRNSLDILDYLPADEDEESIPSR